MQSNLNKSICVQSKSVKLHILKKEYLPIRNARANVEIHRIMNDKDGKDDDGIGNNNMNFKYTILFQCYMFLFLFLKFFLRSELQTGIHSRMIIIVAAAIIIFVWNLIIIHAIFIQTKLIFNAKYGLFMFGKTPAAK